MTAPIKRRRRRENREEENEERERVIGGEVPGEREIAAAGPRPAFEIQMGLSKRFKSPGRARSQMHRPCRRVF
jgi:hypothetical protein